MKTIERYVFGSFLSSFLLAFVVLTFVLTISLMVKIVGLILEGVSTSLVGRFALVSFPETLQWTIPLALLVSSVLVFSRLSADSEIAAMRACGVNLLQVIRWPLAFALVCTALGFYVNNEIVPRGHEVRAGLRSRVSVSTGIDLLTPGRTIKDFPKLTLSFERKEGNWIYGIDVIDSHNPARKRHIKAAKALVTSEGRDIVLDLYGLTSDSMDIDHPEGSSSVGRFQHRIENAIRDTDYSRKEKDMRFGELLERIDEFSRKIKAGGSLETKDGRHQKANDGKEIGDEKDAERDTPHQLKRERSKARVELAKRFVFAMAGICFVLIGVPLGIRAQRRESSVGMAISLAIALGYYLVVILMISLQKNYAVRPDFFIWLPVAVCFALSAHFLRKHL